MCKCRVAGGERLGRAVRAQAARTRCDFCGHSLLLLPGVEFPLPAQLFHGVTHEPSSLLPLVRKKLSFMNDHDLLLGTAVSWPGCSNLLWWVFLGTGTWQRASLTGCSISLWKNWH